MVLNVLGSYLRKPSYTEYQKVKQLMEETISQHRKAPDANFRTFEFLKVEKIVNEYREEKYRELKEKIRSENDGCARQRFLFHGSSERNIDQIIENGFDIERASPNGMFGAGIYFARNSSKANLYTGSFEDCDCSIDESCDDCRRYMLECRVLIGKSFYCKQANSSLKEPPQGYHSVYGIPSDGGLDFPEVVVYNNYQALPAFKITYKVVK
jgi:tankyrase